MRSPIGELAGAVRALVPRPRNDAPVPYVGRGAYGGGSLALGGGATGDPTTALEAYGTNGTLFAIAGQLSQSVAAVDWHMHRDTGRPADRCEMCGSEDDAPRGVVLVPEHPALVPWRKPNEFFTSMLFTETFQQHLDLVGEAWWIIAYVAGRPIEMWPVRPDRMFPVRDPEKFIRGYVYRSPSGQMVPLELNQVVQLRVPAPWDPYRGAGAVQTLINQLYGASYAASWNRRFFENNATPSGVIELPIHLQPQEWDEFQLRWQESHKGVSNAHSVAILEYGAKYIETNVTMRDMEFAELSRATREQIREAFAMHGHILGLSESVNRANAEAAEYGFAKRQTVPRLERIKDALNGPYLALFGTMSKGYSFAYVSPVPEDAESDNAERTSKASAFSTYVTAGVDPAWAAEVCGLPKPKMAPKPTPPAALPPPNDPNADPNAPPPPPPAAAAPGNRGFAAVVAALRGA